ncbi:MAG: hypothetical protein K6G47_10095 [Clostridia bacterium]|nr:hypothetical protein [Clostridia bacterium]
MNKVLTIDDWYDGPRLGVAYYNNELVIYERIFSEDLDDYTDYYLTPINVEEYTSIVKDASDWIKAIKSGEKPRRVGSHKRTTIEIILDESEEKRKYRKSARFSGEINRQGWIPIDYWVEWLSPSGIGEKTYREVLGKGDN